MKRKAAKKKLESPLRNFFLYIECVCDTICLFLRFLSPLTNTENWLYIAENEIPKLQPKHLASFSFFLFSLFSVDFCFFLCLLCFVVFVCPSCRYNIQRRRRTRTEVVDVAPCTWGEVCVAAAQEALETLGVSENYSNRAIVYWAWGFGYFRLNYVWY
ncbi:hypothetical protein ES332_D04G001800v1 [Gossypium tomentosum]|uniref:Uncharacterized protein n=1 Tax=Gossypium tomentosum TaxID=34277 RepID=A0A5D2L7R9_GOSTO|nr:hypothetical protein ES332_D04G001800v1 [Gossypium tomentosum]